jgi:membrane protein implicated in regulation of membrane protease activity
MMELMLWGILFVVLIVVETITVQLIAIWFAVGSAGAFVATLLHASFPVQLVVFVVVSALLLIVTRPILKKITNRPAEHTNADAIIGKDGIVIESIENVQNKGRAKIDGLTWNARSIDEKPISEGEVVQVVKIEGVTAMVTAKQQSDSQQSE